MKEITIKLTTEQLQALFEGKRLEQHYHGAPIERVTIITDRYGVFMTHEKLHEIKRRFAFHFMSNPEETLKELFPDDEPIII